MTKPGKRIADYVRAQQLQRRRGTSELKNH